MINRIGIIPNIPLLIPPKNSLSIEGLTERENKCAYYLIQGMTAKEIARILKVSYKTVEYYIENMKCKFGSYKKSNLIRVLLSKAGFMRWIE